MRHADLHPPLGKPGGLDHLIHRIVVEVDDQQVEDQLVRDVEHGVDLSNEEAAKVYPIDSNSGVGAIRDITIGPHAEYRMDLRSVTVEDVRTALREFLKEFEAGKSRKSWQSEQWLKALRGREKIEYLDSRNLMVVFVALRPDQVKIITTYWKGERDPKAAGYQAPAGELSGARTFVNNPDGEQKGDKGPLEGDNEEKHQTLPSPPWSRSKPLGKPEYNSPPASGGAADGRSIHKDKVRTKGVPGDESPRPPAEPSNTVRRRPEINAASKGNPYPGTNRQKQQKGTAKSYYKEYYKKNRGKVTRKLRSWYKSNKFLTRVKKDRKRRRDNPEKFQRKPSGGYFLMSDRSRDWRQKRKEAALGIEFIHLPTDMDGVLEDVNAEGEATVTLDGTQYVTCLDTLLDDIAPVDEAASDRLFALLDALFEYIPGPEDEVLSARVADFLYEKSPPEMVQEQRFDRGTPQNRWPRGDPLPGMEQPDVWDNPGSAKVIPDNRDFVNHKTVVAARISEILDGLDPGVKQRGKGLPYSRFRVNPKTHVMLFDVTGSSGTAYRVRIKVLPKGTTTAYSKLNVLVSCSCPFWRWQGPEHWAKTEGYLYGKPRGTASEPVIKDPPGVHRVCKHVVGILRHVSKFSISRPTTVKLGSLDDAEAAARVAVRYLEADLSRSS